MCVCILRIAKMKVKGMNLHIKWNEIECNKKPFTLPNSHLHYSLENIDEVKTNDWCCYSLLICVEREAREIEISRFQKWKHNEHLKKTWNYPVPSTEKPKRVNACFKPPNLLYDFIIYIYMQTNEWENKRERDSKMSSCYDLFFYILRKFHPLSHGIFSTLDVCQLLTISINNRCALLLSAVCLCFFSIPFCVLLFYVNDN